MPYDRDLDECVFSKACDTTLGRLTVSVYSYNKGPKKLQFSRENKNNEGELRFAKLGRMTREEIDSIMPLIQESLKHLD